MSGAQAGETGGLVAATGLDTDETVLNDIDTANTVTASNGVSGQEEVNRVSDGLLLTTLSVLKLDGDTLLEEECEVLGLIRGRQRVLGQLPHIGGRSCVGVLQDAGLVGAVSQVLIHGPGLGLGGGDGNVLPLGIVEQVLAALEALVEDGIAPRRNDLDGGLEGVEGKLEANLVVTLTSAAVGDSEAALALVLKLAKDIPLHCVDLKDESYLGDFDLGASDDGTSQGGTKKVDILVDGVASNCGEAELLNEFAADVNNLALERTDLQGLLTGSLEVLCQEYRSDWC